MTMSIQQAAIDLAVAGGLSALIGFERQWRNRLAGLRTNTLVALGAASFVIFEALFPDDSSPTRVAAQVVPGIGFLGAGIIFREGLNVRGLNTAATIWCSAAVGVLAGAGYPAFAAVATAFVLFVNLLMRPIVMFINRQPLMAPEIEVGYLLSVRRLLFRPLRCLLPEFLQPIEFGPDNGGPHRIAHERIPQHILRLLHLVADFHHFRQGQTPRLRWHLK